MQELKQSEIKKIINTYSVRKDEFREAAQGSYKSTLVNGYLITLSIDSSGRIIASHTQDNGKRTFIDVWERINDKLCFKYRNMNNQPLSDADYIKDLERRVKELEAAGRELQERLNDSVNNCQQLITDTHAHKHNERGAGRKPSQERLNAIAEVKALLDAGSSEQEIISRLNISRATFYRYKRNIIN